MLRFKEKYEGYVEEVFLDKGTFVVNVREMGKENPVGGQIEIQIPEHYEPVLYESLVWHLEWVVYDDGRVEKMKNWIEFGPPWSQEEVDIAEKEAKGMEEFFNYDKPTNGSTIH